MKDRPVNLTECVMIDRTITEDLFDPVDAYRPVDAGRGILYVPHPARSNVNQANNGEDFVMSS